MDPVPEATPTTTGCERRHAKSRNMTDDGRIRISASKQVTFNLMVSSHERSGTHFLINSLALNSPYTTSPVISFDPWESGRIANFYRLGSVRDFFEMLQRNSCNSIIKNHFHPDFFFDGAGGSALGTTRVLYVVRHPVDVLASFRRFIQQMADKGHREGPVTADRLSFMLAEPAWNMMRYQSRQYPTILERWIDHAMAWRKAAAENANVRIVRYDDLNRDYEATMIGLLEFIGQPRPRELRRPDPKTDTVYVPNNESLTAEERQQLTVALGQALSRDARIRFDELLSFLGAAAS